MNPGPAFFSSNLIKSFLDEGLTICYIIPVWNTSKLLFKSHTAIGFYVKTISAHGSHLGWRSWSPDTILKVYYPPMGKNVLKSSPLKLVSQYSKHVIDGP
jgi:hypothetical protein